MKKLILGLQLGMFSSMGCGYSSSSIEGIGAPISTKDTIECLSSPKIDMKYAPEYAKLASEPITCKPGEPPNNGATNPSIQPSSGSIDQPKCNPINNNIICAIRDTAPSYSGPPFYGINPVDLYGDGNWETAAHAIFTVTGTPPKYPREECHKNLSGGLGMIDNLTWPITSDQLSVGGQNRFDAVKVRAAVTHFECNEDIEVTLSVTIEVLDETAKDEDSKIKFKQTQKYVKPRNPDHDWLIFTPPEPLIFRGPATIRVSVWMLTDNAPATLGFDLQDILVIGSIPGKASLPIVMN